MEHESSRSTKHLNYSSRDKYDREASKKYRVRSRSKSRSRSYRRAKENEGNKNYKSDYKSSSKNNNYKHKDQTSKESSKYRKEYSKGARSRSNSYGKYRKHDPNKTSVKQSPPRKERKR